MNEREITRQQLSLGYFEYVHGIFYERHYHVIRDWGGPTVVVEEPEPHYCDNPGCELEHERARRRKSAQKA